MPVFTKLMINIKTERELEIMKKGGKILSDVMLALCIAAKPGVSELELDALAQKLIEERGAEPGFKKVEGYNNSICTSVNDVSVHGIPTKYKLKEGDVLGIDCGVYYKGLHTDMAETIQIKSQISNLPPKARLAKGGKSKNSEIGKFLEAGKYALAEAIKKAKTGNHIGDISNTIQSIVEAKNHYSVVRSLVGHGVGRQLHEEPEVPGYLSSEVGKTPLLKEGMTIAIEVIYNMGKLDLTLDKDGWTLKTKDGSLAGLFERSVAITKNGPVILTA